MTAPRRTRPLETPAVPLSGQNYAAELVTYWQGREHSRRTLAIAAGLTHDEAVAYVEKYRGTLEVLAGFVEYKFS